MKIKKLIYILLGILILSCIVFVFLYARKQDPRTWFEEKPIDFSKPPKFLYAVNNDPQHPLDRPMGVAVIKGNIFISDAGTKQVLVFDYNGKFMRNLKLPGNKKFNVPYGLAYDGSNIYVADTGSGIIYVFDANGNYLRVFPTKGANLQGPSGLNIAAGKLYVADLRNQKVLCFDLAGKLLQTFGSEGSKLGQFAFPQGIVVGKNGDLYVSDSGNNRVEVFASAGQAVELAREILAPRGITIDSYDNIWIVAGLESVIRVFTPEGTSVLRFGTVGKDYGMLSLPNGIFIDSNNRIYITELGNHRVSVYAY